MTAFKTSASTDQLDVKLPDIPRPAVTARRLVPATEALAARHFTVDADAHKVLSHPECPSLTAALTTMDLSPDPNTVTTPPPLNPQFAQVAV